MQQLGEGCEVEGGGGGGGGGENVNVCGCEMVCNKVHTGISS